MNEQKTTTLSAIEFGDGALAEALKSAQPGDRIVFVAAEPTGADTDGISLDIVALGDMRFTVEYNDFTRSELLDGGAAVTADRVLHLVFQLYTSLPLR